ncbi:hypothetical protein EV356DRAFT_508969 [Viridothelium virens]|uniref:Uncharacterized protein n=1 Tax=Viridothelium virens TaxID=1048519 RepID=A0A6A6GXU8_VIRVR|nr:hypothetical protein EV356DRAFT_508969 [Viridothelium virens]
MPQYRLPVYAYWLRRRHIGRACVNFVETGQGIKDGAIFVGLLDERRKTASQGFLFGRAPFSEAASYNLYLFVDLSDVGKMAASAPTGRIIWEGTNEVIA